MSRGSSGRIVLEIDPRVKETLYVALAKQNTTLKDWFLQNCISYLNKIDQPDLFVASGNEAYGSSSIKSGDKR